jgi:hypothetical protein
MAPNVTSNFWVHSQHGAQTWLGSSPTPAIIFLFPNSNFYFTFQLAHVIDFFFSINMAPNSRGNPQPKHFSSYFNFLSNRNFNLQISHVLQHNAQLVSTNLAKIFYFNFHLKNTLIFFYQFGLFLSISFSFRTPEILHLHFFFPSTLWKFFFGHLDFFFSQNT